MNVCRSSKLAHGLAFCIRPDKELHGLPNDLLSRNAVRDERRCGSQAFVGSSMLLLCRAVSLSTHHNREITVKATAKMSGSNNFLHSTINFRMSAPSRCYTASEWNIIEISFNFIINEPLVCPTSSIISVLRITVKYNQVLSGSCYCNI
jgi:hypothetical protein